MHWAVKPARIIWAMPRASLRSVWLIRAFNTARMCHWDEGIALAEKALKLAGPSAVPYWWWPKAKRAWSRGEYAEAYEAFQRAYIESFWLSHLDLAYTLPFLGRVDEAKHSRTEADMNRQSRSAASVANDPSRYEPLRAGCLRSSSKP
jgi:tetratricopeptide (TPR) repeat protein